MASSLYTLTSGFFPSNNHDRLYTSDQLAFLFSSIIADGAVPSSSGDPGTVPFRVAFNPSDGTAVTIGKGLAWLKNTWTNNSATASLSMMDTVAIDSATGTRRSGGSSANNGNPRWDAVAIEINKSVSVRANSFVVVEGVPGANPSRPDVSACNSESEGRYYYALAYLYRPAATGYTISGQSSDKLVLAIAQNGGIPYVTSLVSEATSIDDLLTTWNDEIESNLDALKNAISEAGQVQLLDFSVTTQKLAEGSVTSAKIANGAVGKSKIGFPIAELVDGKIAPDNASSGIVEVTASLSLTYAYSGKMILARSDTPVTLTLPSSGTWAVGTEMEIVRYGTGPVVLASSRNAKLLTAANGEQASVSIANTYGVIALKLLGNDNWLVTGDIG